MGLKKVLCQKKFWVKKNFSSEKNLGSEKKIWSKDEFLVWSIIVDFGGALHGLPGGRREVYGVQKKIT